MSKKQLWLSEHLSLLTNKDNRSTLQQFACSKTWPTSFSRCRTQYLTSGTPQGQQNATQFHINIADKVIKHTASFPKLCLGNDAVQFCRQTAMCRRSKHQETCRCAEDNAVVSPCGLTCGDTSQARRLTLIQLCAPQLTDIQTLQPTGRHSTVHSYTRTAESLGFRCFLH